MPHRLAERAGRLLRMTGNGRNLYMKEYCFGIDVGGTTVKLGLFRTDGTLLKKWEIKTRTEEKGKYILDDIADSVKGTMQAEKITADQVKGVGIGVPGPTRADGYVEVCVNLGWDHINPAKELSEKLGIPVKAGNDANVAALGEMWKGGGEGYQDVVLLTLGTGVGGGVVLGGRMVAGNRGLGGELGHITVNMDETDACNCGNHGCLEQYASATGVVRVTKKLLAQSNTPSVLRGNGNLSAKAVFDAAKEGDALALEAVEVLGRYLGLIISSVALTVDPDIFVIGGGVSRAGSILTDVITKYYHRFTALTQYKVPVVLAKLGNDAGIYGSARMALDD